MAISAVLALAAVLQAACTVVLVLEEGALTAIAESVVSLQLVLLVLPLVLLSFLPSFR